MDLCSKEQGFSFIQILGFCEMSGCGCWMGHPGKQTGGLTWHSGNSVLARDACFWMEGVAARESEARSSSEACGCGVLTAMEKCIRWLQKVSGDLAYCLGSTGGWASRRMSIRDTTSVSCPSRSASSYFVRKTKRACREDPPYTQHLSEYAWPSAV